MVEIKLLKLDLNSYIGGIIDGEGWIRIKKGKGRKTPKFEIGVGVENTNKKLIDLLYKYYGGRIYTRKRKINWKPIYSWYLGNLKALIFLEIIAPYLYLKRERADICMEMAKSLNNQKVKDYNKGNRISDKEVRHRDNLFIELKKLNERGIQYV